MNSKNIILSLVLAFLALHSSAQLVDQTIQQGNELYKQKQYQQAEQTYSKALEQDPTNTTAKFNRAVALFRENKFDEPIKQLDDLAFKTENNDLKANAYYNKGVILSTQKRLEESIEAYKNTLRRNPNDKDARENLQKALLELKKKQPEKKDDNKKQQQQQKKQPQPKMNQKEAQQRLKLLEQKEKEVQQRLQKEKSKQGGGQQKDW